MSTLAHFKELDTDNNHVLDRAELKTAFGELLQDSGKDVKLDKVRAGVFFSFFLKLFACCCSLLSVAPLAAPSLRLRTG